MNKQNSYINNGNKNAIKELKNAMHKYEQELKNLDIFIENLENDIKHLDSTSQEYQDNLKKEIELLELKNNLLKKNTEFNNRIIYRNNILNK